MQANDAQTRAQYAQYSIAAGTGVLCVCAGNAASVTIAARPFTLSVSGVAFDNATRAAITDSAVTYAVSGGTHAVPVKIYGVR